MEEGSVSKRILKKPNQEGVPKRGLRKYILLLKGS